MNAYIVVLYGYTAFCIYADSIDFTDYVRFITNDKTIAFFLFDDVLKIEKETTSDGVTPEYDIIYRKN